VNHCAVGIDFNIGNTNAVIGIRKR
jgi:hypothetical protein